MSEEGWIYMNVVDVAVGIHVDMNHYRYRKKGCEYSHREVVGWLLQGQ